MDGSKIRPLFKVFCYRDQDAMGMMKPMNRTFAVLLSISPCALIAHPCPHDWNIHFAENTEIKGDNLADFLTKFNEAVKKESKDKVGKAIILDLRPTAIRKVPEDSPFSKEMNELIKRYPEVLRKEGFPEFGSSPIALEFPAKFPVACLLIATFSGNQMGYEETEAGAVVSDLRADLECRAYEVSDLLLEKAEEWRREGHILEGAPPLPYIFARFSEMTWAYQTYPDPENPLEDPVERSVLVGVTLYIPGKEVVLAIETKEKHAEMTKAMGERGYLKAAGH